MAIKNVAVRIDEELWKAVKVAAIERGESLQAIVERALKDYVDRKMEKLEQQMDRELRAASAEYSAKATIKG